MNIVHVAEVDPPNEHGIAIVWLYADHGAGNMEPVCWPDDWPDDIDLAGLRARGVDVREAREAVTERDGNGCALRTVPPESFFEDPPRDDCERNVP